MKLSLMSLHMTNFKGFKDNTFVFDGTDCQIKGKNGEGKTTVMTAWAWLIANVDADLHSNPNIRPICVEECVPRVEAVIDVDGVTINLAKQQKTTVSKPNADGVSKITLTNSYEINSVPKSERDFKVYLTEHGINFDLILPLSHPDVFTNQKSTDMRKVLFGMVDSISDKGIIEKISELTMLPKLLANYTVEEIAAMQKATLRKINDDYGKDGEILRAKIEGLESGKVDIDVSAIELGKADATRRLVEIKAKIDDATAMDEGQDKITTEYYTAKNRCFEIAENYKRSILDSTANVQNRINEIKREISRIHNEKESLDSAIVRTQILRGKALELSDKYREDYRRISREEFDDNTAVCPTCGQSYPSEKIASLKADFEANKVNRLKDVEDAGKQLVGEVASYDKTLEDNRNLMNDYNTQISALLSEQDDLLIKLSDIQTSKPVSELGEYQEALKNVETLKAKVDEITKSRHDILEALRKDEESVTKELIEYEKLMTSYAHNDRIDAQINELLNKQKIYEQNRADAEAILYEIDLLSKRKNELLTDEINSHFKLVKFVLFDYLKNGSYVDCCKVTLDGKTLGESTNTGREVLAKLDIINGLQNFYGQYYPVFVDGAECLSEDTMNRIDIEAQLIMLTVSECGLTVEER